MPEPPELVAPALYVTADDLSGAAETGAVLARAGRVTHIVLAGAARPVPRGADLAVDLTVVDLDSRGAPPAEAARRTTEALAGLPPATRIVKKIDSLLRGNLAAEIGALAQRSPVVLAAALPAAGRTVEDGVVRLSGTPLHETGAWRMEPRPAPRSVAAALGPVAATVLGLDAVRGGPDRLAAALGRALQTAPVVVCDAVTDADLDAIARAALARPDVALAGSGGFAAALGRALPAAGDAPAVPPRPAPPAVLVVVGSAEEIAARQVQHLLDDGAHERRMPTGGNGACAVTREPLPAGVTVLRPDPAGPPADPRAVVAELARAAVALDPGPAGADLVLTGGETARRVLDALGVDRLEPLGQTGHGAVRSRTPDGRHVVTRPGSFGGPHSLRDIVADLRGDPTPIPIPEGSPS